MPRSLASDAVAAVEDAFLRGEWTQALSESRGILAARIVQPRQEEGGASTMTTEEERVLSVYLQAVFELDLDDEVETAATIAKAFVPLPSGIAIQWSKFLLAMNRRSMATQALRELLASFNEERDANFSMKQYADAVEVLALQLLLPDEGIEAARQFVTSDTVLDDAAKLQLLRRIQAAHLAILEAVKDAALPTQSLPNRPNGALAGEQHVSNASYESPSGCTGEQHQTTEHNSCYAVVGGTAIALAVVAAGALRYREQIHECVSSAIPAISKGLADAKYALFEA